MKPSEIFTNEIAKQPNTDIGILNAYYETAKELIKIGNKQDCISFLRAFKTVWGEDKATDLRGDFIDAGILTK